MLIFRVLNRVLNHPLNRHQKLKALMRFVGWQIASKLINLTMVFDYAQRSRLFATRKQTVATGNYYCGLFEFDEMSFVLHYLRPGDLFVDVGANIGSFTVLAASEVGVKTISVEPIPSTYAALMENIRLNGIEDKVHAFNVGLGAKEDVIRFTNSQSAINHVATEGETNTIEVPVRTYDDLINDQVLNVLVKIDVEGFETEVLKGMQQSLDKGNITAILIETNNSGVRYGHSDDDIHSHLTDRGFLPFLYDPFERELTAFDPRRGHQRNNTVYLRDPAASQTRLKAAEKVFINGVFF